MGRQGVDTFVVLGQQLSRAVAATTSVNAEPIFDAPAVHRVAMLSVHTSPFATLGGPSAGGMNVYIRELSRYLAERGVAIDVFTRREEPDSPPILQINEGVRLIQIDAGPPAPVDKDALFCFLPDFATEMAYLTIKEELRYDVIHSHYWLSGWAGHLFQRYQSAPLAQMFHTLAHFKNAVAIPDPTVPALTGQERRETALRAQVERRLMRVADVIIAGNPDERSQMVERLGADESKVRTIPPGIDLDLFQPRDSWAARRALGLPEGPLVLFVGRIDPIKGIDTLFSGFQQLVRDHDWQGSPPKLVFIGGLIELGEQGSTMDADLRLLAERAEQLGLTDQVLFHGAQPREKLPLYYNAVDVCAVPSRYESFGLVAVEAMASGTPIVATRVGGLRFTIDDGVSGVLIPPSEPNALAEALHQVLTDHALRSRMQVGARQTAIRFAWQTITSAVLGIYLELVTGRPDAAATTQLDYLFAS